MPDRERCDGRDEPKRGEAEQRPCPVERHQDLAVQCLDAWRSPTHARIWITGVARCPLWPENDLDEVSGATMTRPTRDGIASIADKAGRADPDVGDPFAVRRHARERREEHLLQRAGEPRERHEDHVRRQAQTRPAPRRQGPPHHQRAQVAPCLVQQFSPNTFPAKPPSRRRLAPREPAATGATAVRHQSNTVDVVASASCWPDDRPGAVAFHGERDARRGADQRRGDLAKLEPPEAHVACEQGHLGRSRRADEEAHGDRREQAGGPPAGRSIGQQAREADPGESEGQTAARANPEDGRAVSPVELAALDERRPEGVVGEHDDEAGKDQHHRRQAPVTRREQAGQHQRDDHPRKLEDDLRRRLPRHAAADS